MIVDCAVYREGHREGGLVPLEQALETGRQVPESLVWIGLFEPTASELGAVATEFELHPLAVEDALHARQRPKLERYGEMLFLVVKTARYVDSEEVVTLGDVMLFLGPGYVVAVRHGQACDMSVVRRDLESRPADLARGPAAVLHAVLDRVVDEYEAVLLHLNDDIDDIQDKVFSGAKPHHAPRIFSLKREVLEFRQAVLPLTEPLHHLTEGTGAAVVGELTSYFRDVYDHQRRVAERLGTIDDVLTSALNANVAQVGMRQNEDMRKISAWVAIVAVPTLVAGIYGMNFNHMPELDWALGYPLILGFMITICTLLWVNFRRREWL